MRKALIIVACLLSAFMGAAGMWLAMPHEVAAPTPTVEAPRPRWTCPMHPTIVLDHPGECPICGMTLVPLEQVGAVVPVAGLSTVNIDPARQQLIGLKTTSVERGQIAAAWRTLGRVAIDETRVRHINVKVSGFVERVFVDFVGKPVARGQALFTFYSPELVAAQEEYLLALRTRQAVHGSLSSGGDDLVAASRRKLQLWDIPPAEIARLERTGEVVKSLTMRSPIAGVVVKKDVVDGMQLEAGAMPYEIVDLSRVWVLADVYESELGRVKTGMAAKLTLKAFPLETFDGTVAFIDPLLDPRSRTVKVRMSFPNPRGDLRPEMFGEVVLQGKAREALRIPADAVIHTGTRSVVFVALAEGKFQPREVELGETDGQHVEVVSGLSAGELVVTRANFLIDSESRLRASLAAMGPGILPAAAPAAEHRHGP